MDEINMIIVGKTLNLRKNMYLTKLKKKKKDFYKTCKHAIVY